MYILPFAQGATLSVDSSRWGLGSHIIGVEATTATGCTIRDSITVSFGMLTMVSMPQEMPDLGFIPTLVRVKCMAPLVAPLRVYNAQGQCVFVGNQSAEQILHLGELPSGLYWIFAIHDGQTVQKALFLQD